MSRRGIFNDEASSSLLHASVPRARTSAQAKREVRGAPVRPVNDAKDAMRVAQEWEELNQGGNFCR